MAKLPRVPDFMLDRQERVIFEDGQAKMVSVEEAFADAQLVVSSRVADALVHVEGSVEVPCASCGELCFRSLSSPSTAMLLCMQCALPYITNDKTKLN